MLPRTGTGTRTGILLLPELVRPVLGRVLSRTGTGMLLLWPEVVCPVLGRVVSRTGTGVVPPRVDQPRRCPVAVLCVAGWGRVVALVGGRGRDLIGGRGHGVAAAGACCHSNRSQSSDRYQVVVFCLFVIIIFMHHFCHLLCMLFWMLALRRHAYTLTHI